MSFWAGVAVGLFVGATLPPVVLWIADEVRIRREPREIGTFIERQDGKR